MSKVLKGECQNGEIGIGPLCPHGMYSVLPNLKIFFYVHPWNEFYGLVIHKSLILTFVPKNYLFRVPGLHRISSVIWTGIAAYRTLCTSQVICKQNTTSKILSMDLKFFKLSLAVLITTEIEHIWVHIKYLTSEMLRWNWSYSIITNVIKIVS